jgi:hypothetical protein
LIGVACAGLVRLLVIVFLGLVGLMMSIEAVGYLVRLAAGTLRVY